MQWHKFLRDSNLSSPKGILAEKGEETVIGEEAQGFLAINEPFLFLNLIFSEGKFSAGKIFLITKT